MKKSIIITTIFFLFFIAIYAYSGDLKTFIVHINEQTIEFKKSIPEFDKSTPDILKIFPKQIYISRIKNDLSFLILYADPIKSDVRDLVFLYRYREKYYTIDYIYDVTGNNVQDILLWDIDQDTIDEPIILWGDEDSYKIVVYKLLIWQNSINTAKIYNSTLLGNPLFKGYGRKLTIYNGAMFFLYSYNLGSGSVHKYAKLMINPEDSTRELYLMPMGLITKEEWLKMQEHFQNESLRKR